MKTRITFTTILSLFSLAVFTPTLALAQPAAVNGPCGINNVNSAIGCIPTNIMAGAPGAVSLYGTLFNLVIGIGGGIALVLILIGIFFIATSGGIPDKIKEGRELIIAALSGLLFIIMSVVLMYLIFNRTLQIPGF